MELISNHITCDRQLCHTVIILYSVDLAKYIIRP